MEAGLEEVMFERVSNVRWEFIEDFGAKVHGAVGEESVGVERGADVIALSSGVVVDRGIEHEE